MITILELAKFRAGREVSNGQDFADVRLPIMGGCEVCGASIAAYNAAPSKSGYLRCADGCIGDSGFDTVEHPLNDKLEIQPLVEVVFIDKDNLNDWLLEA